ncbi:hypothetical protein RintRC_2464 [Richelia intracellularis]|nr:hypothetical protein RintRC_2464 [Richelia intracellularis]
MDSRKQVVKALQDLAIIFADITGDKSEAATQVASAVLDFKQLVKQATTGPVDLRFLFPLGLDILSVRQLMLKGLQFDIILWYVFAWYAFDSFLKFNNGSNGERRC